MKAGSPTRAEHAASRPSDSQSAMQAKLRLRNVGFGVLGVGRYSLLNSETTRGNPKVAGLLWSALGKVKTTENSTPRQLVQSATRTMGDYRAYIVAHTCTIVLTTPEKGNRPLPTPHSSGRPFRTAGTRARFYSSATVIPGTLAAARLSSCSLKRVMPRAS